MRKDMNPSIFSNQSIITDVKQLVRTPALSRSPTLLKAYKKQMNLTCLMTKFIWNEKNIKRT